MAVTMTNLRNTSTTPAQEDGFEYSWTVDSDELECEMPFDSAVYQMTETDARMVEHCLENNLARSVTPSKRLPNRRNP
jgi:hypothetical protein